ncbi:HK97-gp10 family putative phage morphogenesis protein [Azohydromonas lata]|uniref:HK97-gp10 family putative phage morphogenesis protein n=1 Tax=Azohydromonas lata TaxID=45677 RepID=UPI00083305D0|nr:HK97-gp10 family putative phage morphogenesis protein [Azohydromonas lata]
MPSFSMKADIDSLLQAVGGMQERAEAAARPAAQAAAQVLYDAVRANVARIKKHTGNLDRAIYQAFSIDNSGPGRATYHISWNARRAPHGHLVEYGHMQRYVYYKGNDGQIRPMVRPGMDGTPKPKQRASQAVKDAYYVPLPGGPRLVAARPFIRPAVAKMGEAMDEAKRVALDIILGTQP